MLPKIPNWEGTRILTELTAEQEVEVWNEVSVMLGWKYNVPSDRVPGLILEAMNNIRLRVEGKLDELNKKMGTKPAGWDIGR